MQRPSSLACRLVPSVLRTFSKGRGLRSRGSAAHGTLLDTGGAAALWEKSHGPRRVLGQTKEGLDLLAQRREKDPTDCVHGGGAEGPSKVTANPGRRARERRWRAGVRPPRRAQPGSGASTAACGLRLTASAPSRALWRADGHCFPRARTNFPSRTNPERLTAVTRQPAGRREVRTRTPLQRPAHALSPLACLPAFESDSRRGGTRLRQGAALVLGSVK